MPRYLYLLRHAQSAEKQMGQSDRERELTNHGLKQALLIGNFLMQQKTSLDVVMCSIAERAKTTALLLNEVLNFETEKLLLQEELYEASTRTFFQFITQLEDNLKHVMCIGHNPVISYVAEYLSNAEIGEMTPGGMAIIEFDNGAWKDVSQGSGKLLRYIYPEMLKSN